MQSVPRVELGRPATYDDLVQVPEHLVAEILDGDLWTSPRPAPRHAHAHSAIGGLVVPAYAHGRRGPGGWRILFEPELHLAGDVLVPDLAGWKRRRMPTLPDRAWFELAPDWICEIVSPSTARLDRRKLQIYVRERVRHAWIVDPVARTLQVLRSNNHEWMLIATHGGADCVRAEPFEKAEIDLPVLWDESAGTSEGQPLTTR